MFNYRQDQEDLRNQLLDDMYAGAFAGGIPALLLDEEEIKEADAEQLTEIARRYGYRK